MTFEDHYQFTTLVGDRRLHPQPPDKFLANEKVFSYVIPNKDRMNYTTGIAP